MWWTLISASFAKEPRVELEESGPLRMEDKRDYRNLVVLGPRLFPPGIGGRYLHSLSDELTLMVGAGYGGIALDFLGLTAAAERIDARAGLDFQPLGNGMHGFYAGPRVVYKRFIGVLAADDAPNPDALTTQTLGAGGVIGWRWIWDPGLSLGLGLGATYTTFLVGAEDDPDLRLTGLAPVGELTVGWAF